MKRYILAACVLGLSLGVGRTASAAQAYNFYDLSPSIPHKSGTVYDGMWNDGKSWFVTNGADSLIVDGTTYAVKNVSPALRYLGMGQVVGAAGDGSRWLIAGLAGTNEFLSPATMGKQAVFIEFSAQGVRRVDLSSYLPEGYSSIVPVGVNGRIFVLFPGYYQKQDRLFAYAEGKLAEIAIPESATGSSIYQYTVEKGRLLAYRYAEGKSHWSVFDGQNWGTTNILEAVAPNQAQCFVQARGVLNRGWTDEQCVHYAYALKDSRDRFRIASRRPDGAALLGGYGTNGLRLVLLLPINNPYLDEDEIGNIRLTATAVPGSGSKYVLRAVAASDVSFIRLLKNGIGFKKCSGRVCEAVVDVKGTADRFEAWAEWRNGELGYPLTSRSMVLRDRQAVQEIVPWHGSFGLQQAKSTVQPDSFNPTVLEKSAWHLDFERLRVISDAPICKTMAGQTTCGYPSKPSVLAQAFNEMNQAKAEIVVENKVFASCQANPLANGTLDLWKLKSTKQEYISAPLKISRCAASINKLDVPGAQVINTGYRTGSYTYYPNPAQIRVFAKITWKEKGKTYMMISPTDTVTYQ